MKMKKLTALALAGVLCLGMSTVAFAADSPQKSDAIWATEEGKKVDVKDTDDAAMTDWEAAAPEDLSETVKDTFHEEYKEYKKELDKKDPGDISPNEKKQLELLDSLANDDAVYEIVTTADIKPADGTVIPKDGLNVRFDLTGKFDDLAEGQTIRILHRAASGWQVYETEVKLDKNGWYAEWAFKEFSPVAVFRVNSDNSITPDVPEEPTEPTEPTVTPDGNGSITADQLADLIAQRLQQNANATSIARTSTNRSPKTGE